MAIDFKPDQNEYGNLSPFKTWLKYQINTWGFNNFPFLENDFDQLTEYGMMMKLMKSMYQVIENQNLVEEDMDKLYTAYTELQTYIDNAIDEFETSVNNEVQSLEDYMNNYFANLDVQEEINNKLDEMLEDGVLEQIIEQFLQSTAIWCFNTVADMKDATNLTNGSFTKTLGYYSINDDGGATYKIRTKTNDDVIDEMFIIEMNNDNTLIAELIIENDTINIMQIGAKEGSSYTITDELKKGLSKVKNIIFPSGNFYVDENIILNNNNIKGNNDTAIYFTSATEYGIIKMNGTSSIDMLHLIDEVSDNGCFLQIYQCKDCYVKNSTIESVSNIRCGAICDVSTNSKNLTIYNSHFICRTNADGGFWIRTYSSEESTENITIEKTIIDQYGRDEPLAIWGWNGTVKNVYVKDSVIRMFESSTGSQNVYLIRVGFDGTLENVFFDNCIIDGKYTQQVLVIESAGDVAGVNSNINFNECTFNVTSTLSRGIASGKINFYNCTFNSTVRNKLCEEKSSFTDCTYNCENQGTFGSGSFYNCIINSNPTVETTYTFITLQNEAKYINCTLNGVNYNNSGGQFINLIANGKLELENFKANGTINANFFILSNADNTVLKLKNSILNAKSFIGSSTTGYIVNCISVGAIDGGANVFKHNNATNYTIS